MWLRKRFHPTHTEPSFGGISKISGDSWWFADATSPGKGGGGVGWAPEDREATIRRLLLLASGLHPSPDILSFHLAPTTGDEQLYEGNGEQQLPTFAPPTSQSH